MAFVTEIPVRFGDVDYAGIIYYPRLFHLLHVAFEQLFERHAGISYHALIDDAHVAFPTVHIETDFRLPLRFGDLMRIAIEVPRLGTSSVDFDHTVSVGQEPSPRVTTRLTRVAVDPRSLRPVPIPEPLRTRLLELDPSRG